MQESGSFRVDKKVPLRSPLAAIEKRFIERNVGRFPRWIEGYHLTLTTIAWSAGLMIFGCLARGDLRYLWGSSLMLFLQWFTDSFDGALGRHRDTGIPKWGFYMDHLLDYVFMSCVFLQYLPIVTSTSRYLLIAWTFLYGVKMVSSWLAFAAMGEFKITYLSIGPTEIRLFFILLNTFFDFLRSALARIGASLRPDHLGDFSDLHYLANPAANMAEGHGGEKINCTVFLCVSVSLREIKVLIHPAETRRRGE